jgi:HPt (histidine-containing phosphotransfer) domain-containing protein
MPLMETITPVNKEEVLARLGDDEELLGEIVQMYFEDYPGLLSQMRQAINESNAPRLTQAAHDLKGLLSNFSSTSATTAVQALEQAGRLNELNGAPQQLKALESELTALSETVRSWLNGR